jgi:chemotaxis protein CheX
MTLTMTHEQLTTMIRQATRDVFGMMLGVELGDREAFIDESGPVHTEGVVALVGLAGSWAGSGTFTCSAGLAAKISGQLLMQEFAAIDDEVLDAIGEVTNMVLGNVKTSLEEELGPMGLSIPTVIFGRNFTTRSLTRSKWTVVPFDCLDDYFEVRLCLTPRQAEGCKTQAAREQVSDMLTLID